MQLSPDLQQDVMPKNDIDDVEARELERRRLARRLSRDDEISLFDKGGRLAR